MFRSHFSHLDGGEIGSAPEVDTEQSPHVTELQFESDGCCRTVSVMKRERERAKPHRKKRTKDGSAMIRLSPTASGVVYDGDSLDDWDDEELMRGRRRNKNGGFTGRPAKVIPAEVAKELTRRRFQRSFNLMADSLVDAALMLRSIVNDKRVEPADRIRAAELMFNRVLGKPREAVTLDFATDSEQPPWKMLMAKGIVGTVEEAALLLDRQRTAEEQGEIVDGELVEEGRAGGKRTAPPLRELRSSTD